ncbi:hypothetical protein GP476_00115 (plasmid) [Aeromonas dhakensis]|uniref:DUF823 domain-containing adhesin n=1 Tax=Aeromonas dhakensis TaxID=196024 RepID=UPI0021B2C9B9|nr:DUF823 domain-containing adhesin [Aeromonas dhakensis]UXB09957.1 hypothetical protein GP476_00115 [Aeromonas dhakensis]
MKVHQRTDYSSAVKLRSLPAWVAVCLAGMTTGLVWATQPVNPTPKVVGFKPEVSNVAIDKQSPTLGDELTLTYDYKDKDGDADASSIKWLYNGADAGATGAKYTPALNINTGTGNACGDFQVAAQITPTSQTGDPLRGDVKQSAPVTVTLPTIPGFTFPDLVIRGWSDADAFCKSQGMTLPTVAQLQAVFSTYTSGGTNYTMAQKYGWPLPGGRCGGANNIYANYYWASDAYGSASHYVVQMTSGSTTVSGNTNDGRVSCVR